MFPLNSLQPEHRYAIITRPRGSDWLEDDVAALRADGIGVLVSALETHEEVELGLTAERAAATAQGLQYVSLPIPDRGLPSNPNAFAKAIGALADAASRNQAVAIHCRQSIGRASLIATALLVNTGMTVDAALAEVTRARGARVPDTDEQLQWIRALVPAKR